MVHFKACLLAHHVLILIKCWCCYLLLPLWSFYLGAGWESSETSVGTAHTQNKWMSQQGMVNMVWFNWLLISNNAHPNHKVKWFIQSGDTEMSRTTAQMSNLIRKRVHEMHIMSIEPSCLNSNSFINMKEHF